MARGLIVALIESLNIPAGVFDGLEGIIHDFPYLFYLLKGNFTERIYIKEITPC
jgi:hypothetical protein